MKLANNIYFRAFLSEEEDKKRFEDTFFKLVGLTKEEIKKQKVPFEKKKATGFNERKIIIYTVILEKERQCNTFLKKISENLLKSDKKQLCEQESRFDEHLNFYLRLNKTKLLDKNNRYSLSTKGDCIYIRINLAVFPKRKDLAKEKVKEIFSY